MIHILAIHNTEERSRDILAKMKKRYTNLAQNPDIFRVTVVKLGFAVNKLKRKSYDRVYYHKDSVALSEITDYVIRAGSPQVFDFRTEEQDGRKQKEDKQVKGGKVRKISSRRPKGKAQSRKAST